MKRKLILIFLIVLLVINGAVIFTHSIKVQKGDYLITNTNPIEGYSDKISYFNGDTIELKIHCREPFYSLAISRYGKETVNLLSEKNLPGIKQDYAPNASEKGARWKTTYSFKIPLHWENGMYSAKLEDNKGKSSYVTFIVKGDPHQLEEKIAVLASTNTWQAYNNWGGLSYYNESDDDDESGSKGSGILSLLRPNPQADPTKGDSHLAGAEIHVLSWLESNGYPYKLITDYDLDKEPAILDKFKILIISTHNEYWTENMYNALDNFQGMGGNLLYLSGNGVYWKAIINDQDQIEVRKDFKNHIFNNTPGGYWTKQLKRPESARLGVRFQNSDFSEPAPYKVLKADHWVFNNTGLKNSDLIGETGLTKVKGFNGGASGWETDQMDENSPRNTVLLAKGTNTVGKGAHMVYYDHPAGGGVFSAGSITFGGSLAVDKDLTAIVKNVLDRFLAQSNN